MAFSDLNIHNIMSNDISVIDIRISVLDVSHNLASMPANAGWHHCSVDKQCPRWSEFDVRDI
jgi:hypothetical protein